MLAKKMETPLRPSAFHQEQQEKSYSQPEAADLFEPGKLLILNLVFDIFW
jgi:hypothetical protein